MKPERWHVSISLKVPALDELGCIEGVDPMVSKLSAER
jgi:hypothetical protein